MNVINVHGEKVKISNALYKVENIQRDSARMKRTPCKYRAMRDSSCLRSPKLSRKEEEVMWPAKHMVAKQYGIQYAGD